MEIDNVYICPHCGDKWKYRATLDHESNKCLITKEWAYLENGQTCTCWKCGKDYNIDIKDKPNLSMFDFVYQALRNCNQK